MKCNLCPNKCNIDRNEEIGFCGSNSTIKIAKYYLHPFEEPPISGTKGSGTIFFTGCSLKCVFCQNYELSRNTRGIEITPKRLSEIFKELEDMGAHNINLVTPTHYDLQIIEALNIYKPKIPIVYNTHSYENLETLKMIDNYIDIYLPDLKYFSPVVSKRYTGFENYFEKASEAIKFMFNKKTILDENGILKSGVIVRHLILPLCQNDSKKIINWFYENNKNGAYISIMSQYTPFGDIEKYPELKRKITEREYNSVISEIEKLGIENCFVQDDSSSSTSFIPKWDY